jgi:predicted RNase H-like HicB family nuclease
MVLRLTEAKEGGFVVTSPLDPELVTQAESIGEAFENATDAARMLRLARVKLLARLKSKARAG